MNCKTASEHISAWLDNEVDAGLYQELKNHYESCENCRARMKFEEYSKNLVHTKIERHPMPVEVRNKIHAALEQESKLFSPWKVLKNLFSTRPAPVWGMVLAAVALVVMVTVFRHHPAPQDLSQNWMFASARHCYEHNSQPLTGYDFTEEDLGLIAKRINDSHKRDFQVAFPAVQPVDFKIHGCKYCELGGKPSIYLALKEQGHHVAVEIINGEKEVLPRAEPHSIRGEKYFVASSGNLNQILWKKNNLIYVVTSDLPEEKLARLVTPELITLQKSSPLETTGQLL
jgi:anti-sigma factor (TIGR02949 family)